METMESSSSSSSSSTKRCRRSPRDDSTASASLMMREALSFVASIKEGLQYIKASFTGQVRKLKAKSEQEASEAELQASKMQVEAADEAEEKKKQLATVDST